MKCTENPGSKNQYTGLVSNVLRSGYQITCFIPILHQFDIFVNEDSSELCRVFAISYNSTGVCDDQYDQLILRGSHAILGVLAGFFKVSDISFHNLYVLFIHYKRRMPPANTQ